LVLQSCLTIALASPCLLKQALVQATGSALIPAFLPEGLGDGVRPAPAADAAEGGFLFEPFIRRRLQEGPGDIYAEAHRQLDRILLPLVLEFTGGNQRLTARFLGIARQTFRVKLREAGFGVKRLLEEGSDKE
jgi:two-component system nitrogen regulation response regulator GlnG